MLDRQLGGLPVLDTACCVRVQHLCGTGTGSGQSDLRLAERVDLLLV
jgi:hypothetical protein